MLRTAALAALFLSAHLAAYATDVPAVLFEIETRERALEALRFAFTQQVKFSGASGTVTNGSAVFAKGGRFRVEKSSPEEQTIVCDGRTVWVYSPKNRQVWTGRSKAWMQGGALPKGLVPFGHFAADLRTHFRVQISSETSESVVLSAAPKNDWGYRLEITFSKADWLPRRSVYVSDAAEIVTTLVDLEPNPMLATGRFRFSAPPGTDVIPLN